MTHGDQEILPLAQKLTRREMEVLSHIGEGLTNREISEQLTIALSTVKWYMRQIYNKLGVSSREEAIERAKLLGLLPDMEAAQRERVNLPAQLTSFIGRTNEIYEIKQLLAKSRLVSLTGPGGSGKTRLALEVARESADQFADGIHFISLASVIDPGFVASAIAHELGIPEMPNTPLVDSLISFLEGKEMLLLLDNFEHLQESAPLVSHLLTNASRLTILVTSRERLHLSGETEYLVLPLKVPDLASVKTASTLSKFESVTLFVQRAAAVSSGFSLSEENAAIVARICSQLDGLPLAIELAAARVKLLPPRQLLEKLDNRLRLLTSGPRDLPARQQTLRNTIDWSYELLTEDERRLCTRMSVFSGGRSYEAIVKVCCEGLNIEPLDGLESLLNKSLIYQIDSPLGEPRFKMLDTIREYAREQLALSDEEKTIRNHHFLYFLELMEDAESELKGSNQVAWMNRLDVEHDNLLAAVDWCQSREEMIDLGLRMSTALASYFEIRGYYSEGREILSAALSASQGSHDIRLRAKALRKAGLLAYMQGDYPATRSLLEESLSIYRELGPEGQRGLADALITLGDMKTEVGEYSEASSLMKEALAIMEELKDIKGIARAFWQLGACAVRPGDYKQAQYYFEKALPLLRQIGDRTSTGIALSGMAEVAIRQGDFVRATELEEESLELRREVGETWGIAVSLGNLAWIALCKNDTTKARVLLIESLTHRYEIGDTGGMAWCLEKLAEIAIIRASDRQAKMRSGYFQRSATLFGAAAALRAPSGSVIDLIDQPEYERQLARVKDHLDKAEFTSAWAAGEAMTLQQVINYALAE